MTGGNVLERIFDAYGGLARWERVDSVRARFSSGGALFVMRGQSRALLNAQVSLSTKAFGVALQFAGGSRWAKVTSEELVLSSRDGAIREVRKRPRASFESWRSQMSWDDTQVAYFASYAIWNYLCFPFLLSEPSVLVTSEPRRSRGPHSIRVRFPRGFPTHSCEQRFWFDGRDLMYRHDYVAEVVGPHATAANFADQNVNGDGIVAPRRRRVVPRLGSLVLPVPTLVWIDVHEIEYRTAAYQADEIYSTYEA